MKKIVTDIVLLVESLIVALLGVIGQISPTAETAPSFRVKGPINPVALYILKELKFSLLRCLAVHLNLLEIVDHCLELIQQDERESKAAMHQACKLWRLLQ